MRVSIMMTALALAACGQAGVGGNETDTGNVTAPEPQATSETPFTADIALTIDEGTPQTMSLGTGLQASYADAAGLVISGSNDEGKSSGKTSGAAFVIEGERESQISGHDVTVKVRAMGAEGTSMDVAYSTGEVGNSGWKTFELTPEVEEYTFPYSVSHMVNGRGDYIAIVPVGGDVTVTAVGVDIGEAIAQPEPSPGPETTGGEDDGGAEAEQP